MPGRHTQRRFVRHLITLILAASLLLPVAGALAGLPLGDAAAPAPAGGSTPRAAAAAASAADYVVRFRCPEQVDAPVLEQGAVCPQYVLDREDIFGQPVLMVDPRNPDYLAFSAMHGGHGLHAPGREPPTERSRDNGVHQPHTTFTSKNGAISWNDQPYHAPDALKAENGRGRDIFGEDNAAVQDAQGRMYLAAAYSYRDVTSPFAAAPAAWQYAVGVWKAKGPEYPVDYHVNTLILDSGNDGTNRIDSLHIAYARSVDIVVTAWREEAPAGLTSTTGNATSVVLHWTQPGQGAVWTRAPVDIGPCARMSNPITVDATLYVACKEADAPARVHAVDLATWDARVAGEVDVMGDALLLVKRGDHGHMVLVSSGLDASAAPVVEVAYGESGGAWSLPQDMGPRLSPASDLPLAEARVTAAAYAPRSGNLHFVYMERYDLASANANDGQTPEFAKVFGSMVAEGRFLAAVDLGVGQVSRVPFSPTLTGVGGGVYNDLHDSIVIWDGEPYGMEDREFVAYGDHGYVRFGEVVEENFVPPIPLAANAVPPVPLATPGSIPVIMGVGAGVLSGAMVARTIAARRAAAVEVGAE